MVNQEHLDILKRGVKAWNQWRKDSPDAEPDLSGANLSGAKLYNIDLSRANLEWTDLSTVNLRGAILPGATLSELDFGGEDLSGTDLRSADLKGTNFRGTDLSEAQLSGTDLSGKDFRGAKFRGATLIGATLTEANFSGADLSEASLRNADLSSAILIGANLHGTDLSGAILRKARLWNANLSFAYLSEAEITDADLSSADMSGANLTGANLHRTNLSDITLDSVDLTRAILVETDLTGAKLTNCWLYGTAIWDVELEGAQQSDLIITHPSEPTITVENLEVAQFIYLLLNNKKIRDAIDTVAKKAVLILGRFILERKAVLDALRNALRLNGYAPILFDFDKPSSRDFTETILTLAGLSCFIIADITNPKSSPLELQATVPNYMIPFVPLIQEGEQPFSMFQDLKGKYDWVLDTLVYDTPSNLIKGLELAVIQPALEKRAELLAKKVEQLRMRHIGEYL